MLSVWRKACSDGGLADHCDCCLSVETMSRRLESKVRALSLIHFQLDWVLCGFSEGKLTEVGSLAVLMRGACKNLLIDGEGCCFGVLQRTFGY